MWSVSEPRFKLPNERNSSLQTFLAGLYNVCVRYSPCRCSQQHLPVVTSTVNEHVTRSAVGARAAETLRGVALLQRALILLHGQTVIGQTQLLVGGFGVQLEGLTCEETQFDTSPWIYNLAVMFITAQIFLINNNVTMTTIASNICWSSVINEFMGNEVL